MQDLLDAMAKIAEPVIVAYHDDFRVHDAKVILALSVGDVILWAPREHGSHLIVLARRYVPNESAAEHFAAITAPVDWYRVQITPTGAWDLTRCIDAAEEVARYAHILKTTRSYAEPVRELHL